MTDAGASGLVDYVCLTCALRDESEVSFSVNPLTFDHKCPVCKQGTIILKKVFESYASQAQTTKARSAPKKVDSREVSSSIASSIDAVKTPVEKPLPPSRWTESVKLMRMFLTRCKLIEVTEWWDGYHFYCGQSFAIGAVPVVGDDDCEWHRVILVNKDRTYRHITFYYDPEDQGLTEVGDVQKA